MGYKHGLVQALSCLIWFAIGSAALAQSTVVPDAVTPDSHAMAIYGSVLSPFCPGRLLKDCPSEAAAELKAKIMQDLAAGKTKEAVLGGLYARYGDEIRTVPATEGAGLLVWLLPGVFFFAGLIWLLVWVRAVKSKTN